jgi:hypothetical protein
MKLKEILKSKFDFDTKKLKKYNPKNESKTPPTLMLTEEPKTSDRISCRF